MKANKNTGLAALKPAIVTACTGSSTGAYTTSYTPSSSTASPPLEAFILKALGASTAASLSCKPQADVQSPPLDSGALFVCPAKPAKPVHLKK